MAERPLLNEEAGIRKDARLFVVCIPQDPELPRDRNPVHIEGLRGKRVLRTYFLKPVVNTKKYF